MSYCYKLCQANISWDGILLNYYINSALEVVDLNVAFTHSLILSTPGFKLSVVYFINTCQHIMQQVPSLHVRYGFSSLWISDADVCKCLYNIMNLLPRKQLWIGKLLRSITSLSLWEIDNDGVIEPDTDEPQEMGEFESIEVRCRAFSCCLLKLTVLHCTKETVSRNSRSRTFLDFS